MIDTIAALAKRFWSVHPNEIQDLGITREQFYEREMRALVATQAARIEALEAALAQIAELTNAFKNTTCSTCRKAGVVARAALVPEQDK